MSVSRAQGNSIGKRDEKQLFTRIKIELIAVYSISSSRSLLCPNPDVVCFCAWFLILERLQHLGLLEEIALGILLYIGSGRTGGRGYSLVLDIISDVPTHTVVVVYISRIVSICNRIRKYRNIAIRFPIITPILLRYPIYPISGSTADVRVFFVFFRPAYRLCYRYIGKFQISNFGGSIQ